MSIRKVYIIAETMTVRAPGDLILEATDVLDVRTNRDEARQLCKEINLARGHTPRPGVSAPVRVFAVPGDDLELCCDEETVVR